MKANGKLFVFLKQNVKYYISVDIAHRVACDACCSFLFIRFAIKRLLLQMV